MAVSTLKFIFVNFRKKFIFVNFRKFHTAINNMLNKINVAIKWLNIMTILFM